LSQANLQIHAPKGIPNVTKKEIVRMISEEMGLTQLQTKDIVQRTLDEITRTLVAEGRIELRNFGVFEIKRHAPRKARNPRTGEKVDIPAKNVVTFKPGKEMEEQVRKIDLKTLPEPAVEADPDQAAEARDEEDEKAESFPRLA
jgi:nucleoid DNA-binding protein